MCTAESVVSNADLNQGVKLTCKDGKLDPRCAGKPDGQIMTTPNAADAKVRAAADAPLDPAVINTRVNEGNGLPDNGLLDKIRILCTNQPERVALSQTVETQLKAVGFEVTTRADIDVLSVIYETQVERVAYQSKVHGIAQTQNTMFYLDKAWIEK